MSAASTKRRSAARAPIIARPRRSTATLDTADLDRKLKMPILVLWGNSSSVGKRFADPLGLWRQRAEDVRGEALPSGHNVNEEAPQQVLDWFLRFFVS
jgi:haloacetate dehalogenase